MVVAQGALRLQPAAARSREARAGSSMSEPTKTGWRSWRAEAAEEEEEEEEDEGDDDASAASISLLFPASATFPSGHSFSTSFRFFSETCGRSSSMNRTSGLPRERRRQRVSKPAASATTVSQRCCSPSSPFPNSRRSSVASTASSNHLVRASNVLHPPGQIAFATLL